MTSRPSARGWNVPAHGAGHVMRFEVDAGRTILELWVPAGELEEFNEHIVRHIDLVHEFHSTFKDVTRPRRCGASYPQSVEKPLRPWDNHLLTSTDGPRPQ